ncbi:hypothetical protein ACIRRI_01850 [Streptomyces mirabilis]|uniref:hypothetical protein n=1 Tax=Streptomyces mirabilis TaxID=68239 RepID=UPI00381B88CD
MKSTALTVSQWIGTAERPRTGTSAPTTVRFRDADALDRAGLGPPRHRLGRREGLRRRVDEERERERQILLITARRPGPNSPRAPNATARRIRKHSPAFSRRRAELPPEESPTVPITLTKTPGRVIMMENTTGMTARHAEALAVAEKFLQRYEGGDAET